MLLNPWSKHQYKIPIFIVTLIVATFPLTAVVAQINEAEAIVERFENRYWCAELCRLRGVFLAAMGAEETQIEASFRVAINTARQQKSISLEKRAEATYAEYRRQKASGSQGRGFRLPLW